MAQVTTLLTRAAKDAKKIILTKNLCDLCVLSEAGG